MKKETEEFLIIANDNLKEAGKALEARLIKSACHDLTGYRTVSKSFFNREGRF
mgnify:CR=1 FL=1